MANCKWDLTLPSLYKKFEGHFMVGNIMAPRDFDDPEMLAMFRHHYNTVTAENVMKPVEITSEPGVYDFSRADQLVSWAEKHKIAVVGHTLIWHGQSAPWLNRDADGAPLTRARAKANMEAFIKAYAGHYSGRIYSWDVINEAFRDITDFSGDWRAHLRREEPKAGNTAHWYLSYANGADTAKGESGADYVFDAFYFTRKHDPLAILYYNDYNEEVPAKRDAIACMVEDINGKWLMHPEYDNRLLIEGIGMQSHHNHVHINMQNIRDAINRFAQTGARIAITELDFTFGSAEAPVFPIAGEDAHAQAAYYKELFELYATRSDVVERVTFWAKDDGQSWRKWGAPVLFDAAGAAKPAFHAIMN
ncbi:MAG: endo-1,4-beta-xylanase [Defluviitaleaceae bacterium]|nr:endo-1,4-beta-xylanase [Defluviitaleaceae bacterium]MCL2240324.1 endo-1,4-beta-xylanase [Defluviitaleaceae bacterium]